jgi:hypothetical protein
MLNNPILTDFTNLRRSIILASPSILKFNNRQIKQTERACLFNMERAKRRIKLQKSVVVEPIEEVEEVGRVVPNLPAYASQYR